MLNSHRQVWKITLEEGGLTYVIGRNLECDAVLRIISKSENET